jgi:hypothetical protein
MLFFHHKYGTKKILIGVYDPFPFQCPECKKLGTVDIAIYCEYYHFWYIPIFPHEKDGSAKCSNCDLKINSVKFNKNTKELFQQIKRKFRYPFYTYIGAIIFLLPGVLGLLAVLLSKL